MCNHDFLCGVQYVARKVKLILNKEIFYCNYLQYHLATHVCCIFLCNNVVINLEEVNDNQLVSVFVGK